MLNLLIAVKCQLAGFLRNEKGDVNVVSMVMLVAAAVVLALLFKEQIGGLVKSLLEQITGSATNATAPIG